MNSNNNEEQQSAAEDNEMSYIDRVVFEAGGTADDIKESAILAGEQGGENAADDCSVWSEMGGRDSDVDESSDEEMEYDSDEESIQIQLEKPTVDNSIRNLSETSKELLLWRLDKDVSFSDWTIEVSITDKRNKKMTYHVHKTTLGLGPKKSDYFEALLKSGQYSESSNSTSVVELPEDTAKYFDVFLDYLYAPLHECACLVNRDNRHALEYLAKYFLVFKLSEDICAFIEKDMSDIGRIEEYLTEFGNSEDGDSKRILAIASKVCTENILHINEDSTLLYMLPPAMFIHVLGTVKNSIVVLTVSDDKKAHICRLAITYMRHHLESLHLNVFAAITGHLPFPEDTCKAGEIARNLLEIKEEAKWKVDSEDTTRSFLTYDSCFLTAIMSRYLEDMKSRDIGWVNKVTEKLPRSVVSRLLEDSLAKNKIKKKEYDISCKIMNEGLGMPVGSVVKVSIRSTDSISYILYLLRRKLNLSNEYTDIHAYVNGKRLRPFEYTSSKVLEIDDYIIGA